MKSFFCFLLLHLAHTLFIQQCVSYLRKEKLGVASFIMLDKMEHLIPDMNAPFNSPEGVPRLFDLVTPSHPRCLPAFYFALRWEEQTITIYGCFVLFCVVYLCIVWSNFVIPPQEHSSVRKFGSGNPDRIWSNSSSSGDSSRASHRYLRYHVWGRLLTSEQQNEHLL